MHAPFYHYPLTAKLDRVIPKNKFYQQGNAKKDIEQLFIDQIATIRWAYKLSPDTISLTGQPDLTEIQIFKIELRTPDINESILTFIDKIISFPIIFEVIYQQKVKIYATYKRLHQNNANKVVIEHPYYASAWLDESQRLDLPLFLKLADLYAHYIEQLLPFPFQHTLKPLPEKLQYTQEIQKLQAQLAKLQTKLKKEKQFNRKVEMNQCILHLQSELKKLMHAYFG